MLKGSEFRIESIHYSSPPVAMFRDNIRFRLPKWLLYAATKTIILC